MRTFELDRKFGVVISPGHSFQFMNTPDEQVAMPGTGQAAPHPRRLAYSCTSTTRMFAGWQIYWKIRHLSFRADRYWNTRPPIKAIVIAIIGQYQPATQTATATSKWEEVGKEDEILGTWEREPNRLHCAFRSEIEHLLIRCGFTIEALYGDFYLHPLEDSSENMIWVARL